MKKVKWGILSTADIAQTQVIPAILRANNAEIHGISSLSGKAKETALKFSIPNYYGSYEDMLQNQEIDAVYIPVPNHLHKKWVIEAARYGKHVLCEKPAALTVEETLEMVEVCKQNNVKFMEAFMYQFHPQHKRVQEIIESGEIGNLRFMRASFSFNLGDKQNNIRMKNEMGGGSIYDVGCYGIHAIRNLLKSEPEEIKVIANIDPQSGVDLSAVVYMKLENGLNAVFDCGMDMAFRHEYEIVGTKGRVVVPRAFRPDLNDGEGLLLIYSEQGFRNEKIIADQYRNQIEHFSQAVLEDRLPSYSSENTIQNMRVIEACYQSIK
ncbi:Gfo/Idh/MocA family oxidoreductase [Neobacillus mesonae]|uniref:Gfo/Idh/MocA family protein n=1 Tax=Neobacillus mesonae TaxID=1193713 RepID=UPI002E1CFB84|nr:Gfo/Idh/MocA family oxidoreductase [Neobacillus mesonae]